MKILFVTPNIKLPLAYGAEIRKWNILQGLRTIGSVDVVACGGDSHSSQNAAYLGCNEIFHLPSEMINETAAQKRANQSNVMRLMSLIRERLPRSIATGDAIAAQAVIREIIYRNDYSVVWVETLRFGAFLDIANSARHITRILDGDDFSWIRDWGILRGTEGYGAKILEYIDLLKMRRFELRCVRDYSCVVRCSEEDAKRQGRDNVAVIQNGTDVPACTIRRPESRIIFVGLLSYPPNRMGMEWFLSEIWPNIKKRIPAACLDVVGRDPSERILSANGKNGVLVHGFVRDLTKLYETAAASVVPLKAGGGTRLKILESLGRAVPVISTAIGAYGIPLTEVHGLMRRDGVSAFSAQCIEVLEGRGHEFQRAAKKGQAAVSEMFDWKVIQRAVVKVVEEFAA